MVVNETLPSNFIALVCLDRPQPIHIATDTERAGAKHFAYSKCRIARLVRLCRHWLDSGFAPRSASFSSHQRGCMRKTPSQCNRQPRLLCHRQRQTTPPPPLPPYDPPAPFPPPASPPYCAGAMWTTRVSAFGGGRDLRKCVAPSLQSTLRSAQSHWQTRVVRALTMRYGLGQLADDTAASRAAATVAAALATSIRRAPRRFLRCAEVIYRRGSNVRLPSACFGLGLLYRRTARRD